MASSSSSQASRLFIPNALAEKQIWHITAPASVPIRSMTEIALESVRKGEAIVKYGGADYRFAIDEYNGTTRSKLLVPNRDNDGYGQGSKRLPYLTGCCAEI